MPRRWRCTAPHPEQLVLFVTQLIVPLATMFRSLVTVLLLVSSALATSLEKRQWTESKYCNPTNGLCYLQVVPRGTNPIYRIAIPDNASGAFDTVLEIIAPISIGWAGFSWGGSMTANPLTVAWPNGQKVTVSSRWSTYVLNPTSNSSLCP
jgi:hypothetical protein